MALEFFDGKLKGDISQVYINFVNCDIEGVEYIGRRYPNFYRIVKRWTYKTKKKIEWWECTDIVEIDWSKYEMWIKKDRSKIAIYKWDTKLFEEDFEKGLYERFVVFDFVKWEKKAEGVGKQVICSEWNYFEVDSGDLTDIIPSDYIYVYDWNWTPTKKDWMPGQVKTITRVDWQKIYIDEWWLLGNKIEGGNMKYVVFSDWWKVFGFATKNWFYVRHNDNTFLVPALLPKKISAIIEHKWLLCMLDDKWNFWNWRRWKLITYITALNLLETGWGYYSLVSFNDYVVLFSQNKIATVILEKDKNTWDWYWNLYNLTDKFWLFSKYSYTNWQENLYVVTNYKRIVSINIIPAWYDKFKLAVEPQSFYDTWLEVDVFDEINIVNDTKRLYIFGVKNWRTKIFIFDYYYKIWLQHIVEEKINNYKQKTFIWAWIFEYIKDYANCVQKIKWIFWSDNRWVIKYFRFIKLYLASGTKITSYDTKLRIKLDYDNKRIVKEYTKLKNTWLARQIAVEEIWQWTLGSSIIWDILLGGEKVWEEKFQEGVIRIDTNLYGYLLQCELESAENDSIAFEGFLLAYEVLPPDITERENVYIV